MLGRVNTAGASPRFCTTSWTMVRACSDVDDLPGARNALAELYHTYWYPLYAYLRRAGYSEHDAEDLVQSFYAYVQEKHAIAKADRERGRFRTFLLSSLRNFLSHERERAHAQKRGGGQELIFLDARQAHERYDIEPATTQTPENAFDTRWAHTLLEQTLARVQADFAARGKQRLFERLRTFLTGDTAETSYQSAADALGLPLSAVKTSIHRMRRDYRERLREEIGRTVASPAEIDDELRYLRQVLASTS